MKISLDWLCDFVRVEGKPAELADALTMAGLEIKKITPVAGDTILETEITTNRPDWLSHVGVARELYAVLGGKFLLKPVRNPAPGKPERTIKVSIPDRDLCPYYSAVLLEDVKWGETPSFMKKRLEACGIRSINLPVDITNYVLLERGQPLHAFDADRLNGAEIRIRRAQPGEKITAIDGAVYSLTAEDLVIADAETPVAIAGVMGGKSTEVVRPTTDILLESAFFSPQTVRRTSRRLALMSESSYRFERSVDPSGVDRARERAVELFLAHAKVGRVSPVFHSGGPPLLRTKIQLPIAQIRQVLGVEISPIKAKQYLTRLGLHVTGSTATLKVSVPSNRPDLKHPVDLIEEIARLYGYHRIPETLPEIAPMRPRKDPDLLLEERTRDLCRWLGFSEAISFSLVESRPLESLGAPPNDWIRLVNPKNKDLALMRPTLLSGLLGAVKRNIDQGREMVRLFEVGKRYLRGKQTDLPHEERVIAMALAGQAKDHWFEGNRGVNFYDLKGAVEGLLEVLVGTGNVTMTRAEGPLFAPGRGISIVRQDETIGHFGELSTRARQAFDIDRAVFFAEISLEKIGLFLKVAGSVKELAKFPASPRDLTLVLGDSVASADIQRRIGELGRGWIQSVTPFACFRGGKLPPAKKSLSYRISYQVMDRTLQNEEVNNLHFSIVDKLISQFGATLPK